MFCPPPQLHTSIISPAPVTSSSLSPNRRADETLPRSQLDQKLEGRHRAEHVLNTEVTYVLTPDFGKIQSERVFSMKSFTSPSGTTLMFRLSSSDSILGAEIVFQVAEFNIPSGFRPIMPSRRPRMKEYSKGIVFVSSRQSILIYKSSQSEFICKS